VRTSLRNALVMGCAVALAIGIGVGAAQFIRNEDSSVNIDASPVDSPAADDSASPSSADPSAAGVLQLPGELFVRPDSRAAQWVRDNPQDPRAKLIAEKIVNQPSPMWFGEWSTDLTKDVSYRVNEARQANSVPLFLSFEPLVRGCEPTLSKSGTASDDYAERVDAFAKGVQDATVILILEPDSLDNLGCVDEKEQELRLRALTKAVDRYRSLAPNALVYLDAGPAPGVDPEQMVSWLDDAGLRSARGFALNVSGFRATGELVEYADSLNRELESRFGYRKPYVIDTSRNGAPDDVEGDCNPTGARMGESPRVADPGEGPELFIWASLLGESSGPCGQAPNTEPGDFVPKMAAELAGRG
jgi:endoglucanase